MNNKHEKVIEKLMTGIAQFSDVFCSQSLPDKHISLIF